MLFEMRDEGMTDEEYLEAALLWQALRSPEWMAKSIRIEPCGGRTRWGESGSSDSVPSPPKKTRKRKPPARAKASMEAVQRGAETLQLLRQRMRVG
jgi:hypothetical protein